MKNLLRERSEYLKRPLILDGAMGSLLQMRGISVDGPLWSANANVSMPKEVTSIHDNYIKAGADIITTNTFRTNPHAVRQSSMKQTSVELVEQSVRLARKAAKEKQVIIAGSNAPC